MSATAQLRTFRAAVEAETESIRAYRGYFGKPCAKPVSIRALLDARSLASETSILCFEAFGLWSLDDPMPEKKEIRDRVRMAIDRRTRRAMEKGEG